MTAWQPAPLSTGDRDAPDAVLSAERSADADAALQDQGERVDCAVVVVTYNSERHILPFLDSLWAAAGKRTWRVIVVDNASSDATLERAGRFPDATCVQTGANRGYSAGINVGRAQAGEYDTLLVANPDVRLGPGSLERLYCAVTEGGHAAAVPRLLDGDGRETRSLRREPSVGRQLGEAVFGDHLSRRPAWLSEIVREPEAYGRPHTVDWAAGAVVMVSAGCDRAVGPWDESFLLFSEEVDYASRIRAKGFSIAYVPEAEAVHEEGGSGRATPLMGLMVVNRLRYYRQRHGPAGSAVFTFALLLQLLLRAADREHRRAAVTLVRAAVPGVVWNRFETPGARPGATLGG